MGTTVVIDFPRSTVQLDPASPHILRLRITPSLNATLEEMARSSQSTPGCVAAEAIEVACAQFRSRKLSWETPHGRTLPAVNQPHDNNHRRGLSQKDVEQILVLRDEGFTIEALSKRFRKSTTYIGRMLKRNEEGE